MKKFLKNYLTPDEQKILIFLLIFGFLGISLKFWGLKIEEAKTDTPDVQELSKDYKIKIDLRTANEKILTSIPGIGPKKAKQIVEYRDKFGFNSKADLMKIKGIGKKTYERLEDYFIDFGEEEIIQKKSKRKIVKKTSETSQKIDLNKATYEELISLKGIGPKKAENILALKKSLGGKFTSVEQLTQIKGIGKKTVEKLKKYLFVGEK